eukprot:SAG11_NODE_8359_length_1025_cov_1.044276_3_plen_80_part_00
MSHLAAMSSGRGTAMAVDKDAQKLVVALHAVFDEIDDEYVCAVDSIPLVVVPSHACIYSTASLCLVVITICLFPAAVGL